MAPLPTADVEEIVETEETPIEVISRSNAELDAIITRGMSAMRETFEKAGDWKPSDANRAREVGAQIMKATIDAIKQKQDTALKRYLEKNSPKLQPQSNTTNIFADRNTILKMIKDAGGAEAIILSSSQNETDIS